MSISIIDSRYEVIKVLGRGGMGEVYQVKDMTTGETVALKMLSIEASQSESVLRFKREFRMLTQMRHPNLCMVYDFGTTNEGRHYFTMEYVEGVDFFNATRSLDYEQIYDLVVQVCRALSYIHSKGLIHYDIKPGNILIKKGQGQKVNLSQAKLMDFGLAGERTVSTGALIKGTIQYMAPEVVKGISIDARADLYSLGVVLYEIVAGGLTLKGDTSVTLLRHQLEMKPEFSRRIEKDLPAGMKEIVTRLMAKDPTDRYQDANEVIKAINKMSGKNYDLETVETKAGYILSGRFVGRDEEFSLLKKAFDNREARFVLIDGEMGSGKTRLLREFRYYVQLHGGLFLLAACDPKERDAYQPLKALVRQLVLYTEGLDVSLIKQYGAELMKLVPRLSSKEYMKEVPPSVTLDPKAERLRLFHNIVSFIKAIRVKGRPFVLVLENLQWVDEASLEWLRYSVDSFKDMGVFVLGTFRNEEVTEDHRLGVLIEKVQGYDYYSGIHLKNLALDDVCVLVGTMLGDGSRLKGFSQRVYDRTRGNPFFIEQVMYRLVEEEKVSWEEGVLRLREEDLREIVITTDLSEVIEGRLARLGSDSLRVLQMAAVIGKGFDFTFLMEWGGFKEIELHECIKGLKRKGFFIEELEDHRTRLNFAQAGVKEMLYNRIEDVQRRQWHCELGGLLETIYAGKEEEAIDDLSYHYLRGGDTKKAFLYSVRAGEHANSIYATQKALNYYNLSIDIYNKTSEVTTSQDVIDLYYKRGNVLETLGEYQKALADFGCMIKAAKKTGDRAKEAEGIERTGIASWRQGDFDEAIKYHREAMKIREEIGNRAGAASSLGHIGSMLWTKGMNNEALGYFKKAISICEELDLKPQLGAFIHNIGLVYSYKGNVEKTYDYLNRSLVIFKELNQPRSIARNLHSLCNVYYYPRLLLDTALSAYEEALKKFEEIGDRQGVAACLRDIGETQGVKGNFDDAIGSANKALKIFQEIGEKRGVVTSLLSIGRIYTNKEHYGKAFLYYKKALDLAEKIGEKSCVIMNTDALGATYCELGDTKKAEELHLKSYDLMKKQGLGFIENSIHTNLGKDYLYSGDISKAEEYFRKTLKKTIEREEKYAKTHIHALLSETAFMNRKYEEAEKQLKEYIENVEEIGARHLLAKGYLLKARYQMRRKKTSGKRILKKAHRLAEELDLLNSLSQIYLYWCEIYFAENNLRKAFDNCKKCIQTHKIMVAQIDDKNLKNTYLQDQRRKKIFKMFNKIKNKAIKNTKTNIKK